MLHMHVSKRKLLQSGEEEVHVHLSIKLIHMDELGKKDLNSTLGTMHWHGTHRGIKIARAAQKSS